MSTETAPPTDAPEIEPQAAETPEVVEQEAPQETADEPQEYSLDDLIDKAFDEADAEGQEGERPRDEKGRFVKQDEESPESESAQADSPAETASPERTEGDETAPDEPAPSRILTPKVDGEVREIDIDEWWGDESKRTELTETLQKGMSFDTTMTRRYNAGVQDIVNALSAQGYGVVRDNLAPGGVRVVPPAATTPQETQAQTGPSTTDPVTMLSQEIEALEAQIEQAEQPTVADFLRLQKKQRELAAAHAETLRAEQEKYRTAQEEAKREAQQQALREEFQRRVGGLIQDRTKGYGDRAKEFAEEAGTLAYGRMHTAQTIEEVEATLRAHFDRLDSLIAKPTPTPTPSSNGKDTASPAVTTPPPKKSAPPPVGAAGARSGVASSNKLAKAKTIDDLDDEDWQRIIAG